MTTWLRRLFKRDEDAAWKASGYHYTTPLHHDQAQGEAGRLKALHRAQAARKVADMHSRVPADNVVRMDRRRG